MRAFHVLVFALGAAATAPAQGCPFERVKVVPASYTAGPGVACDSGVDLTVAGIQLKSRQKECPLFIIITPTHEVPEPSTARTRVVTVGVAAEYTAFFNCVNTHFLFWVVSSSCKHSSLMVTGQLPRLRTEGCPDEAAVH